MTENHVACEYPGPRMDGNGTGTESGPDLQNSRKVSGLPKDLHIRWPRTLLFCVNVRFALL